MFNFHAKAAKAGGKLAAIGMSFIYNLFSASNAFLGAKNRHIYHKNYRY